MTANLTLDLCEMLSLQARDQARCNRGHRIVLEKYSLRRQLWS